MFCDVTDIALHLLMLPPTNKVRMIYVILNDHIKTVTSYTFKLYSKMFGFKLWCSQALIYNGISSASRASYS